MDHARVRPSVPLHHQHGGAVAEFTLPEGAMATFVMREIEAGAAWDTPYSADAIEELRHLE